VSRERRESLGEEECLKPKLKKLQHGHNCHHAMVIPVTTQRSYLSPCNDHTCHHSTVIPVTMQRSYLPSLNGHTCHHATVIPATTQRSYLSPCSGHTCHHSTVIPVTMQWSYLSPRSGQCVVLRAVLLTGWCHIKLSPVKYLFPLPPACSRTAVCSIVVTGESV